LQGDDFSGILGQRREFQLAGLIGGLAQFDLDHDGPASQHRHPKPQQQPRPDSRDSLDIESVVLAGQAEERPDVPTALERFVVQRHVQCALGQAGGVDRLPADERR
jgi:hypothetical protein